LIRGHLRLDSLVAGGASPFLHPRPAAATLAVVDRPAGQAAAHDDDGSARGADGGRRRHGARNTRSRGAGSSRTQTAISGWLGGRLSGADHQHRDCRCSANERPAVLFGALPRLVSRAGLPRGDRRGCTSCGPAARLITNARGTASIIVMAAESVALGRPDRFGRASRPGRQLAAGERATPAAPDAHGSVRDGGVGCRA